MNIDKGPIDKDHYHAIINKDDRGIYQYSRATQIPIQILQQWRLHRSMFTKTIKLQTLNINRVGALRKAELRSMSTFHKKWTDLDDRIPTNFRSSQPSLCDVEL